MTKLVSPLLFLSLIFGKPVFAFNPGEGKKTVPRSITVGAAIKKIILYGDADIILVEDISLTVYIEGKAPAANSVVLLEKIGEIEIRSGSFNRGNRPVIRIPAQDAEFLEIHGDGSVTSDTILSAKDLKIFINGHCDVSIRTLGKVHLETSEEYYLRYKKNEKIKLDAKLPPTNGDAKTNY